MTRFRRVGLRTGVTLNVGLAGPKDGPALLLLHGFPESHRTWRELVPLLEHRFRLILPDQRGYGGSDRPPAVDSYRTDTLVEDVFALCEALGVERFSLLGHDFGGVLAWSAATRGDPRLERLAIVNAPHPVLFQKSLIEDSGQRAASRYISMLRSPGAEKAIEALGLDHFFERVIVDNAERRRLLEADKQAYLAEWSQPGALTAMLNWYRAMRIIVPPTGVTVPLPDWLLAAFPRVQAPTLVVWGMRDPALLPVQLEGLDRLVDEITIVRVPEAGHFVPWEAPERVAQALEDFLG